MEEANGNQPESVRAVNRAQGRITSACLQCRRRKKRCDGSLPACSNCSTVNLTCQYIQRKQRGPGKSKSYIQNLEERLERLEASFQKSTESQEGLDLALGQQEVPTPSQADNVSSSTQDHNELNPVCGLHRVVGGHVPDSEPVESSSTDLTNPNPMRALVQRFKDLNRVRQRIEDHLDREPFRRQIFSPRPPESEARALALILTDGEDNYSPLLTILTDRSIIDQQYTTNHDTDDNPGQWALFNTLLASGVLLRASNESLDVLSPMAWGFFKNAYSTVPELLLSGTDSVACEAFISMAIFLRAVGDARGFLQLAGAAAQILRMIALTNRQEQTQHDSPLVDKLLRAVWVTQAVSSDATMKYGVASLFGHGEPEGVPTTGDRMSLRSLQIVATLSLIQSRIHKELYVAGGQKATDVKTVRSRLRHDLDEWLQSVPALIDVNVFPDEESCIHAVSMRFEYHSAKIKIYSSSALSRRQQDASQVREGAQEDWHECTSAARAIINLLHQFPRVPLITMWGLICHPLSAALILLAAVLSDPFSTEALPDVNLMRQFVAFLRNQQAKGGGIEKIVDGCSKLHSIAAHAIKGEASPAETIALATRLGLFDVDGVIQSLRLELLKVTDWMQLAQGLLTNLPGLKSQADALFSRVLGVEGMEQEEFGMFAPEVFDPRRYNFFFKA